MSEEAVTLFLPFLVPSPNRKESFTQEMESASVFCLTEMERHTGGGLIVKQPPEKILFLTKIGYPVWLIPRGESSLVVDALNTVSYSYAYNNIPDVKAFNDNVKNRSKTLPAYMAFLSDHLNYFREQTNQKKTTIHGLITNPNLLGEFTAYSTEARQPAADLSATVQLYSALDEASLASIEQELANMTATFKDDAKQLYDCLKLLNRTTNSFLRELRAKIKAIQQEYGVEIQKKEAVVNPKIEAMHEEYDEQINQLENSFEKRFQPLRKEQMTLEKTKERTAAKIEEYKVEAKTHAMNKDEVGEKKWKEKTDETKKQLNELEDKIKQVRLRIKETEQEKSAETFRLRSESESRIADAKKDLLELEAERDAKIEVHKLEMSKLKEHTSTIIGQMDTMAKLREASVDSLGKLGMARKTEKYTKIYVPFYLACYQSTQKRRYVVIPPSIINIVGLTVRLKGVLGRAKIKQTLTPRSKSLTEFLNRLPSLIEKSPVLERYVVEEGEKANILVSPYGKDTIRKGLKQLQNEGWLSDNEQASFINAMA